MTISMPALIGRRTGLEGLHDLVAVSTTVRVVPLGAMHPAPHREELVEHRWEFVHV